MTSSASTATPSSKSPSISASSTSADDEKLTLRAYQDGEHRWAQWQDNIFAEDSSHKCPTYVHRTPPCQGSCPSGEDVRGWLQIVRGIEKPPAEVDSREYAFRRVTDANPFPSIMGRVCPAPCEQGCNRNEVDDFVGINAVEQFIGDQAFAEKYQLRCDAPLGAQRVAIVGAGPAGLAAAYQLRRKGHGSVIFDDHAEAGGMMRYGIPSYRTPREILGHEIQRILDLGGIELRMNTRVGNCIGSDMTIAKLESEFDAVLWALGCKSGRALPIPGGDAPNCISGIEFLEAFNLGRLQATARRVVCVGGGDTSIDVVSVARRIGNIPVSNVRKKSQRPDAPIGGYVAHDSAYVALREGAEVTLTSLFPREAMTATEHEVEDALHEGVDIMCGTMPVELVLSADGMATAVRMQKCTINQDGRAVAVEGSEFEIECDLVVSAIGQRGDLRGLEDLGSDNGFVKVDKLYQLAERPGHFAAGDIIKPHLLTTAIGHGSVAAESIHCFLNSAQRDARPKVDVHHFNLLDKLRESDLAPQEYAHQPQWGTAQEKFAVHNYEDRSRHEIISADKLFLGHFGYVPREKRDRSGPDAEQVLSHFDERSVGLDSDAAKRESARCMSCGMCFECDNCIVYCPQNAVFKVKQDQSTLGRYVDTDYDKCIGCHICAEVCPTGYIDMGLGK